MSKKLLPCPVCGGDSFIESVTQGGLICSDCGAVSNQVEVADDDDNQLMPKTFLRGLAYKHVTEEESQAKRERRTVGFLPDRRDLVTLLHGLGLMLQHMTESCVAHGLCPPETVHTVRDVWFEFLEAASPHSAAKCPINGTLNRKRVSAFPRWGIPSSEEIERLITHNLPDRRSKRIQALINLADDRCISHYGIRVIEDTPLLIYAHDWLCLLFNITKIFPLPDWILIHFDTNPLTWENILKVRGMKLAELQSSQTRLSPIQRQSFIKRLFMRILSDENIRTDFRTHHKLNKFHRTRKHEWEPIKSKLFPPTMPDVPEIGVSILLPILLIAIRNSGGGVLPVHLHNWIARCQLPYFSAHKCLPQTVDRIEYYRVHRTNCGYNRSLFSANSVPSVRDIEKSVHAISQLEGVTLLPNNAEALVDTCLNMLGVEALKPLVVRVMGAWKLKGKANECMMRTTLTTHEERCKIFTKLYMGEFMVNEIVCACIIVAMKLVFPSLHLGLTPSSTSSAVPVANRMEVDIASLRDVEYTIQSHRLESRRDNRADSSVGSVVWWDSLTKGEKSQFLHYVENEQLSELRPSAAEDVRTLLPDMNSGEGDMCDPYTLKSGKVDAYVGLSRFLKADSLMYYLLLDVEHAAGIDRVDFARMLVRHIEDHIFPHPSNSLAK